MIKDEEIAMLKSELRTKRAALKAAEKVVRELRNDIYSLKYKIIALGASPNGDAESQ